MATPSPSAPAARAQAWLAVVPVALVVLVPLFFLPGAFGPFHVAKWLLVATLVPTGLAVCAACGTLRWPRWQWFMPLLAAAVLSTIFGVAPWMSVLGSPNRNAGLVAVLLGAGAFVLGASVGAESSVQRRVLRAALVTGGIVGVLAVAERFGLDIAGLGDAGEISRARSTWGSATFAAGYFVIVGPIAVAHIRSRDPLWRTLGAVCSVAIAAGLLATGTRGAWLAALVAAALMLRAWFAGRDVGRKGSKGSGSRTSASTIAGIVVAVVALVVVVVVAVPQLGRASGAGRLDLWGTVPSVIADRPILGSGPDTQRVVLPSGIDESFEVQHGSDELHDRAHSLPLDILVTGGVLGLVALAALFWVLGRDIACALHRELVPTAIAAGLVAYVVTLLFAFGDPVIDPIPWMLCGLLWVAVVPAGRGGAGSGEDEPVPSPAAARRLVPAVVFGALAVAGLLWSGGEVLAEYRLQEAMDLRASGDIAGALDELDAAASRAPGRFDLDQIYARLVTTSLTEGPEIANGAARDELIDDAFDRLDAAQRIAGDDPDLMMDRAELLNAAGRPSDALAEYDRIVVLYPNSYRAQLGLGLTASQLDDLDRAEVAWKAAVVLGPNDPRALVNLGILAERSGEPELAADYFAQALEIDPDDQSALAGQARVVEADGG
ncbi:MAG: O-antigen ligase family protein [Microthrixaceae bacterium]